MPYIDINPHRQRPKWLGYVALAVLTVFTVAIVILALTGGAQVQQGRDVPVKRQFSLTERLKRCPPKSDAWGVQSLICGLDNRHLSHFR